MSKDSKKRTDTPPSESSSPGWFLISSFSLIGGEPVKDGDTAEVTEFIRALCDLRQEWRHGEKPGVYTVKLMIEFGRLIRESERIFDFDNVDN